MAPTATRHRHGAKRHTMKRLAQANQHLQLSATGTPLSVPGSMVWERFSVGVRDNQSGDCIEITFDRTEADSLVTFLREHLDEVVKPLRPLK